MEERYDTSGLAQLGARAEEQSRTVLDHLVQLARDALRMDFSYIAALGDGKQVHIAVDGDAQSFRAPNVTPVEETICQRVVHGTAPNVILNARTDPAVADLDILDEIGIGAYVGVPISLSGGRVFGTLCCLSHEPEPALAERDLAFMRLLARLAGDYVDRQELLARHEQERAETLARVTHDLRSPLQSIIGYAELLQSDAMPEYAATVASEALRLNGMLDELLEAQLPGAITFDLREVVAEQARVFRAQSGDHDILVEDAPEPVFVAADRARIVSVVANLLSNSIKYSPAGGRVEIRTERLAASARLSVRDEGVGIPDALQPSIFTRFFRATTAATRDISGTGLGLAFARDAVRDAGGEIGFTSVENDGSTFWIELPLAPGR